ncbi:MAG: UDP-N-acetylmuramoyl-tripeptide--D-alanyl-D-alanine ligase [Patescibacteria group bacterium]
MSKFLKNQLMRALRVIASFTLRKFKPGVIGVTGSVGKTSTKEAIGVVLRRLRRVRVSQGSLNSEVGLPLAIIGDWSAKDLELVGKNTPARTKRIRKAFFWTKVLMRGSYQLVFTPQGKYPELLVLEYGADRPNDIRYLMEIARPQIAVVTAVGKVPVHVEFYPNVEAVAREKARLPEGLPTNGFAVLSADDEVVAAMRERTRAHVLTFGFSDKAEVRVTNFEHRIHEGKPIGISFKLEYGGSFVPVRIDGSLGRAVASAAAAAAAIGIVFGMHLVRIAEALAYFEPPRRRMRLVSAIRGAYLIDDSYNASPLSMHVAIETVRQLPATRKIAVLGDMLEIGEYATGEHESVGREAAKVFDVIITVGSRAKFIADGARERGMVKRNVLSFETKDEAADELKGLIRRGDLVLIKASHAMRLDRVVDGLRQLPEQNSVD